MRSLTLHPGTVPIAESSLISTMSFIDSNAMSSVLILLFWCLVNLKSDSCSKDFEN